MDAKTIPKLFEEFKSERFAKYKGFGMNAVFADTSGNIGYYLIMSVPVRKSKVPFIGSRVLDGTTTKFDWTGETMDLN